MKKRHLALAALIVTLTTLNVLYYKTYVKTEYLRSGLIENNQTVEPQKLFETVSSIIKDKYIEEDMNHQDWSKWLKRYKNKIVTQDDAKVAIDTMIASLNEPYTHFLPSTEFNQLKTSITSKIFGIGVNIMQDSGQIKVFSVMLASPAEKAGLLDGDIITKVDGHSCSGKKIDDVAILIRGDKGTTVKLEVLRKGQKLEKEIVRDEIKIKTVEYNVDKNIGYINLTSFLSSDMNAEFESALEKTKDCEGLIIDLRNNTGGLLENAVFVAEKFIKEGVIVSVVSRNGATNVLKASHNTVKVDKPLVILINEASASASEIFSGAMKDYERATIIGHKSYGKGMVQNVIPLPNKTGLNITIAKYLTPLNNDINKKGITPDIIVDSTGGKKVDTQLLAAKKELNRLISEKQHLALSK